MRKSLAILVSTAAIVAAPVAAMASGTVTGMAGGAVTGAVVGGPVGAVVGGVLGGIIGTAIDPPPPRVVGYVESQPVPAGVSLQGDLALGATVPESVYLYPVPADVYVAGDPRLYGYTVINGQRVIVDLHTRVIVAVVG